MIALLALPALCLWITPDKLTVAGYIDPFFYTGYMVNLRSMVQRYDITYYMLRMSAVLPGYAIYHLIRPETGFYVLTISKSVDGLRLGFCDREAFLWGHGWPRSAPSRSAFLRGI